VYADDEVRTMSDQHVTVATFPTAAEAELVRALLEDEGISVLILGDLAATTFAGMGSGVGSVELQVLGEDVPRARVLLANHLQNVRKRSEDAYTPKTEDGKPAWICPTCDEVVAQEVELCPTCSTPAPASFPPESAASKPGEEDPDEYKSFDADRVAFRSLWLALIGLVLPPGTQLHQPDIEPHWDHLSPAGRRNFYAAAVFTAMGLISGILLFIALALSR
jgi:hypothetical protein